MLRQADKAAVTRTSLKLSVFALLMFAFCFWVLPPLYDLFCEVTGINGKTSNTPYQAVSAEVDTSRTVKVKFIATKNVNMPWAFAPETFSIDVHPGESVITSFIAQNPTMSYMAGQAVPSMAPKNATDYFHKTECFCFNQQILAPGEEAKLGLQFIVDHDLPKAVKTITLSYTLFDVTKNAQKNIEQKQLKQNQAYISQAAIGRIAGKEGSNINTPNVRAQRSIANL